MGILALVLLGAVSYSYLKVDRLPPLSFPIVNVTIQYPQAAAQDVETLVTKPVEDALAGIPGAQTISSTSSEGRSQVRVQFVEGANMDISALDVERRVSRIRGRLPVDAGDPSIAKADPNEFPIMNVALTGAPMDQLRDLATTQLQPALQSVLGVASVNISGGLVREVQVTLDYSKLAAYNLTAQQVATALTSANVTSTVGSYEDSGRLFSMRAIGNFQTPEQMGNLVVAQTTGGPVLLRDLATVSPGYKDLREIQRINGEDAVGISIVKASDANALQVADDVRAAMAAIQPTLPAGTRVLIRNDASIFTRASLHAVQFDLMLAVIIVGFITFLFLHSFRNVLIILLSIPTSMISTFLVMFAMGFSLNLMTLMALALMVGILVDSSIVVVENIHRHLQLGKEPREAALVGRNEIGLATIAIAAADVVVYVPIAFMSGGVGQLFRQYGLTVVAATIFSVIISFTLTPMLASRWMKHDHEGKGPIARFGAWWDARFDVLARIAQRTVPIAVKARWGVVLVAVVLVAASVMLVQTRAIGSEYAPQEDNDNFQVIMTTPPGTSLLATDAATKQFEEALQAIPEV
ncbi:MAG TPA: efflux RND transporter permease subunit, partial [Nocardioidaceae bacterium]